MPLFLATCLMCFLHQPKAQEKQRLAEQLSGLNAAHAEEVQRLRAEMQQLREDAARDAQVQQLQERLAELEKHSVKSCLGQEVEELRQVCLSGDALALLGLQGSLGGPGSVLCFLLWGGPWRRPGSQNWPPARLWLYLPLCFPTALGRGGSREAAAGGREGCPDPAHVGAVAGSGR